MQMKKYKNLFAILKFCFFCICIIMGFAGCGNDATLDTNVGSITAPAKYTPIPTSTSNWDSEEMPPVIPINQDENAAYPEVTPQTEEEPKKEITPQIEVTPQAEVTPQVEITPQVEVTEEPEITSQPEETPVQTEILTPTVKPTDSLLEDDVLQPMATFTPAPSKEPAKETVTVRSPEEIKALLYYIIAAIPKDTLDLKYDCFEYYFEYELEYLTNIEGHNCYRVDLTNGTYKAKTIFISTDFLMMYVLDERSGKFVEI